MATLTSLHRLLIVVSLLVLVFSSSLTPFRSNDVDAKKTNIRFRSSRLPKEPPVDGIQWLFVDQFVFSDLGNDVDQWEGKIKMTVLNRPEASKHANLSFSLYSDEDHSWGALTRAIAENPNLSCKERAKGDWTKIHRSLDASDEFSITVKEGRPHYWYIMLDGCDHDNSVASSDLSGLEVEFHWINPGGFFSKEFSWDKQSLLSMRMVVFPILTIIGVAFAVFIGFSIVKREFHPLVQLYSVSFYLWLAAVLCELFHLFVFAINGGGVPDLSDLGLILQLTSEVLFIMVLFLMANGWTITQFHIRHKDVLHIIAVTLCLFYAALFVWSKVLVSRFSTDYIFMELPGILLAVMRIPCMAFFIYSLVMTIMREKNSKKKMFYRILGIVYSAWFLILPIIIFTAFLVPPTYRSKVIDNLSLMLTSVALVPMMVILLYSKYQQFFLFHTENRELLEAKERARRSTAMTDNETSGIVSANEADFGEL